MDLFIDTHLNDIVVILYQDGKIIKKEIVENEKEHSRVLMPIIKKIVDKKEITSIIVVNGPGSFTGVRLGVTVAKTLAYTLNVSIRTISSLECLAISTEESEKIVGFSDKNGYYIGIFDHTINLIGDYVYLTNKEFEEYSNKYHVITDIKFNYDKILAYALTKASLNPHEVNPIYVKKIAVEK